MARPKNLNTKSRFSVMDEGGGEYALYYRPKCDNRRARRLYSGERSMLYRERAKYSSWYERITSLLKSFEE